MTDDLERRARDQLRSWAERIPSTAEAESELTALLQAVRNEAHEAGRRAGLEEAAKACVDRRNEWRLVYEGGIKRPIFGPRGGFHDQRVDSFLTEADRCADAILKLKDTPDAS